MERNFYDITIIGGGPAGMFAATYSRMHLAKTQIIESLQQLGGQVSTLFPAKKIYDIPGFFEITGDKLIQNLSKQTTSFSPDIFLGESVTKIEKIENGFKITTTKRTTYSRSIIIATGVGAFEPRRLPIENATSFENKQLHYFVKDPTLFSNKDIAIAGGGDSAIDWGIELAEISSNLHLIHRRNQFRALEGNVVKLKDKGAFFETPFTISALEKHLDKLKIILTKVRSDEKKELIVDYLLVNYGFISSNKTILSWGLKMNQRAILVNDMQETNIAGIYAIGDASFKNGKLDLIANSFGEATVAVNNALLYVYPQKRQPTHSTQLIKYFKEDNKK